MRQPSRRAFLGATGIALTSAGCLGRDDDQSASTETTEERTSTATEASSGETLGSEQTVGGGSVTVSDFAVRDSLLYYDTPDSMAVANRDGERYALVSVSGSESGPPPEAFSLVVGKEWFDVGELRGGLDARGPRYDPDTTSDEGYLPFVAPADVGGTDGRIVLGYNGETAAWRLADGHLDALGRPKARFELRSVEIPETMRRGETQVARVVAENVSDVAGTFRGVLNVANLGAAYVPYAFELDAEPGETVTWEKTFDERPPDGADSVGFFLYTVAGDRERRVPVDVGTAVGTATATGERGEGESESA